MSIFSFCDPILILTFSFSVKEYTLAPRVPQLQKGQKSRDCETKGILPGWSFSKSPCGDRVEDQKDGNPPALFAGVKASGVDWPEIESEDDIAAIQKRLQGWIKNVVPGSFSR
jgi:hypothetical protein